MKNVIVTGGLGNQMFQYAYLLSLRSAGINAIMDISYYDFFKMHNGYELERVFGIKETMINSQGIHMVWLRVLNKYQPSFLYTVDKFRYDETLLKKPRKYIFGYWQDEQYFRGINKDIKDIFCFHNLDDLNIAMSEEMKSLNSVSIHIRRGDYAEFGMSIVGEEYYKKAVNTLLEKVDNPVFYILSDDMQVAEKMATNMGLNYRLVSHNRGAYSYKDMFLMSQCKHNIIANSSFSWWGAWLNNNVSKIVIAPQEWDAKNPIFHPQLSNWILI